MVDAWRDSAAERVSGFAPGAAGAATLLALALTLVERGTIDLPRLVALTADNPAKLLGLDAGRLAPGLPADLMLFDPVAPWQINADTLPGRAGNTPFDGLPVQGKVTGLWKGGDALI